MEENNQEEVIENQEKELDKNQEDQDKEKLHNQHNEFTQLAYEKEDLLPNRYVIFLTNLCNLRCSFCNMEKSRREDAMTVEDWIKFIDQTPEDSRITLTGGEPLLFREFEEIFKYIAEKRECTMITNGLLLNERNIDLMLSYSSFKALSVSIDDIGNKLRNVHPLQWSKFENAIKYFNKKRKEINSECVSDAKTVILDENAEQLFEIHKYCLEDLGFDHHSFQFLKGCDIQHSDELSPLDKTLEKSHAYVYKNFDIIKQQLEKIKQYNNETKNTGFLKPKVDLLVGTQPFHNLNLLNTEDHIKTNFKPCKYPWSSVHINVDGTLYPCLAIPMGNVKTIPLKDIIFSSAFMKFKKIIKEQGTIEGCNRCGWLIPVENDPN